MENRLSPGVERTFRAVEPGMFQELFFHFLHKKRNDEVVSSRLDHVSHGRLYKIARPGEHSLHGEYHFTLMDGSEVRLIGLA